MLVSDEVAGRAERGLRTRKGDRHAPRACGRPKSEWSSPRGVRVYVPRVGRSPRARVYHTPGCVTISRWLLRRSKSSTLTAPLPSTQPSFSPNGKLGCAQEEKVPWE